MIPPPTMLAIIVHVPEESLDLQGEGGFTVYA